jgi:hypothetical protein
VIGSEEWKTFEPYDAELAVILSTGNVYVA